MNPDHLPAASVNPAGSSQGGSAAADSPPLRVAVLATGMRTGGGLTVGLNLIRSFGQVEPQNTYFCAVQPKMGYEEIVAGLPQGILSTHQHRGMVRRWLFETYGLPKLVRDFRPDVVIALAGRGLLRPGAYRPPSHRIRTSTTRCGISGLRRTSTL